MNEVRRSSGRSIIITGCMTLALVISLLTTQSIVQAKNTIQGKNGNKIIYKKTTNGNSITGLNNKIVSNKTSRADGNSVSGQSNTVEVGSNNLVSGESNQVTGDGNFVSGKNNNVSGNNNVGVMGATVTGDNNIGMGVEAKSTGANSIAIGNGSQATYDNSVAIGKGSVTNSKNTVSVGSTSNKRRITNVADGIDNTDAVNVGQLSATQSQVDTNATGIATNTANISKNSTRITSISETTEWITSGSTGPSRASGIGSIAIGSGASAKSYDTAIGYNSTVTQDGSTAVGANTAIHSANSVAVGADAHVESGANGGTAIGQNARVKSGATNSVALGKDSVASEPNTASVGSPGNERRITNVAPGVNSTDAVNKGQLDQTNARVSNNSANISRNRASISQNRNDINQNRESINTLGHSVDDLRDESRAGIAAAAALVELAPSAPGKTTVNVGSATFKGEVALGVTAVHRLSGLENLMINGGVSFSNDAVLGRIGASWEF